MTLHLPPPMVEPKVPDVIAQRCHFCSKQLPAWRVHQIPGGGQKICDYCLEWHLHALDFLFHGTMPAGCQECGTSYDALRAMLAPGELGVRMYVVPKDGIYQLLCAGCVKRYLPQRADLYHGTKFGSEVLHV